MRSLLLFEKSLVLFHWQVKKPHLSRHELKVTRGLKAAVLSGSSLSSRDHVRLFANSVLLCRDCLCYMSCTTDKHKTQC